MQLSFQISRALFIACIICLFSCKSRKGAQEEIVSLNGLNVEYYYHYINKNVLECVEVDPSLLKSKVVKKTTQYLLSDINSNYGDFDNIEEDNFGKGLLSMFLISVAKDSSAYLLIEYGKSGYDRECGGINSLLYFDHPKKKWINKNGLLPSQEAGNPYFKKVDEKSEEYVLPYLKIPEKGLEVTLQDEELDIPIYTMKWNGERFLIIE